MSWIMILSLIVVGLLLLLLEILVLPGGISGLVGFAIIGVAVWQTFKHFGTQAGIIELILILIVSILIVFFMFKSSTWKHVSLNTAIDGKIGVNIDAITKVKVGDEGITISRLAPMGKVAINNAFYEATSLGDFIENNKNIKVIKVEKNKIIVKQIK